MPTCEPWLKLTRKWPCYFCRQQTTFAAFILSLQKGASFRKLSFCQILYSCVFIQRKKCNILPLFPLIHIQHSTFPHQPKAGGPSSLSREGNLRAPAPINSNLFCEITLFIFSSILISSSKNVYLLFYAIPRRIVNSQKLYRTKALKWTGLPFLWKFCKFLKQEICSQQRQAIVVAPLWRERGTIEDGGK